MQQAIEALLRESLEDRKLNNQEKNQIRELSAILVKDPEMRAFTRNKAFQLVRDTSSNSQIDLQPFTWLEKVLRALDTFSTPLPPETTVGFSPGTDCRAIILSEIAHCRKTLDICVFTISDNMLSGAISAAFKRGVDIRILTDQDKANDMGSDVLSLKRQGINVLLDSSPWHMHHKFAIFDKARLLNGSFNWTRSATERNQENILVTDNLDLIGPYLEEFENLWTQHS